MKTTLGNCRNGRAWAIALAMLVLCWAVPSITFGQAVCGDGVIDPNSEDCDPIGGPQPNDCCDDVTCLFESSTTPCGVPGTDCQWRDACDGPGTCPTHRLKPDTTACPDEGNDCTDDPCDRPGACAHPPPGPGTRGGGPGGTCWPAPHPCRGPPAPRPLPSCHGSCQRRHLQNPLLDGFRGDAP